MEDKKTIFYFIGQAFATFGIIVLIFIVLNLVIGESTEGYSPLFALGKGGISIPTLCELFLLAVLITIARAIFLTDRWILNMSMVLRNILFFLSVLFMIVIMIIVCKWFPVNDMEAWIGFVISFVLSMGISVGIMRLIEKTENTKMQKALDQYNREE